jgi:uncharacterized protein YbjT (DUF2867 family)
MVTILGASGKTGMRTAEALIEKGERVRCVGRSLEHLEGLIAKGAEAYIGDQADARFLTTALNKDADAAYVLIPPKMDTDDVRSYYNTMGAAIVKAIKMSGLKKVVFLSSLGAERDAGTGPVLGLHDVEKSLDTLSDVDIVFLRAGYFYENTLMNVGLIKSKKIIANTMDPDAPILMVSTKDIGDKAAELLFEREFKGHSGVELFGQRMSYKMIAEIIGDKIGVPDLPFVEASDRDAIDSMTAMGLSRNMAESFVDLAHGISNGAVTTTKLDPAKPNAPTKYCDFVDEVFYPIYKKAA